jgi:hypothetical protein
MVFDMRKFWWADVARPGRSMTGAIAAATVAVVVSASGCGGAKRPHPAASTAAGQSTAVAPAQAHPSVRSTDESRFFASVDPICRQLNVALRQNRQNGGASEASAATARNAALERAAVLRLNKMVPPSSLAADWKTMNKYRWTLVAQLLRLAKDFRMHDTKDADVLSRAKQRTHNLLLVLASNVGFKDCAQVGTNFHLTLGGQ